VEVTHHCHGEGERMTFTAQADRQYAEAKGSERRDQQWILSDRDVWYRNPAYRGPPQPHPDDEPLDLDD